MVVKQDAVKIQRRLAREFRELGYRVVESPTGKVLPTFLRGLSPDLIATKDDDNVVVEVKRADTLKGSNELTELAARVAKTPGWRFELHTLEAPKANDDRVPSNAGLERLLRTVSAAFDADFEGSQSVALIALFSTLERLLRLIAVERGVDAGNKSIQSLIRELSFQGIIDEKAVATLESGISWRNAVWHGGGHRKELTREELEQLINTCRSLHSALIESWRQGSVARREASYDAGSVSELPDSKPALYAIQTASGRINYIGVAAAGHVRERIRQHMSGGPKRVTGEKVTILQFDTLEEARTAETYAIEEFSPKFSSNREAGPSQSRR